jgi:hypothetical protein
MEFAAVDEHRVLVVALDHVVLLLLSRQEARSGRRVHKRAGRIAAIGTAYTSTLFTHARTHAHTHRESSVCGWT